jgi:transporter family-2 protein
MKTWLTAFGGGVLLALMVSFNALLSKHTTPLFSSWVAHGLGGLAAFLLLALRSATGRAPVQTAAVAAAPRWSYLGGLPGAVTVVLAGITINSALGLPGSVAFMLVGQVIFGMASDALGLFGTRCRRITSLDLAAGLVILAGSTLIIFGRGAA